MEFYYIALCFFIYGFLGWCTEVAFAATKEKTFVNRGFLNGPICPIYGFGVVTVVWFLTPYKENLLLLYITSIVLVTALEWATGFVLEKLFHNKWWDYSDMPLNLNGYVCLLFSLIWGVACVAIVKWIHPFIFKGVTVLPRWLGTTLLVILGIGILADLYVTVTNILQLNRHLERMEEIAAELRRISDDLGANISENVVEVMEVREDMGEKLQDVRENVEEKLQDVRGDVEEKIQDIAEDLREKYRDIQFKNARTARRLLRAFPGMKHHGKYKEAFEDLKEYLKKK